MMRGMKKLSVLIALALVISIGGVYATWLGYTKEEYEAYLGGEKTDKKTCKELARVRRLKCAELDVSTLLSCDRRTKSELKSPERDRLFISLMKLIPSTICMIFTVSVIISVKENMTASGIIEILLKLSTLPIIGLKGYAAGYEYTTESECDWINVKSRLLGAFMKSQA